MHTVEAAGFFAADGAAALAGALAGAFAAAFGAAGLGCALPGLVGLLWNLSKDSVALNSLHTHER